jgi:peptide/nickel transport system permease protein
MSRPASFFQRWQNWPGLLLILGFVLVALAAPYISPHDPRRPGPFKTVGRITDIAPLPPSENAILGTLPRGIDVFHALVWGSRDALQFGLIVTVFAGLFGMLYGAVSGYVGGTVGGLLLRIADSFLAFPVIAGVVFFQQLYTSTITALGGFIFEGEIYTFTREPIAPTIIQMLLDRVNPLMLSLILFSWMPYARLVHSLVITLKQTDFVQAARTLGGSSWWIIRKHLLRNSTGPAIVLAARDVGGVVLFQATLTFINIGGNSVWGAMLSQGRNWVIGPGGNLLTFWWVFLPPTLAVMLFGIGWNLFGDSLNDMFLPSSHDSMHGRSFWNKRKEEVQPETVVTPPALSDPEKGGAGEPGDRLVAPDGLNRILRAAREELSRGELSRALHAYHQLIERNRLIDEILPDLTQLTRTYPHEPEVWQALGDALSRAGEGAAARQSYEQAQKLQQ